MKRRLRKFGLFAAAAFASFALGVTSQAETLKTSATIARDVNGLALGTSFAELKTRLNLRPLGGGIFEAEKDGVKYELDFTPLGRLFSIQSVQPLGRFAVDRHFVETLSAKLQTKYGPSARTNPWSWSLSEPVSNASGTTVTMATNWLSAMTSSNGDVVTLNIQMTDFRILWVDQAALNRKPRGDAEGHIRF